MENEKKKKVYIFYFPVAGKKNEKRENKIKSNKIRQNFRKIRFSKMKFSKITFLFDKNILNA